MREPKNGFKQMMRNREGANQLGDWFSGEIDGFDTFPDDTGNGFGA